MKIIFFKYFLLQSEQAEAVWYLDSCQILFLVK